MNKHLIVSGIVVLLICVGLSGCTQNDDVSGDIDKVELLNCDIKTKWFTGYTTGTRQEYEENGFYHDAPSDADGLKYVVTGTAKNIASKPIDSCKITATFSDVEGNVLGTTSDYVSDLYMGESKNFSISAYSKYLVYFEHVEEYTLSISVTLH